MGEIEDGKLSVLELLPPPPQLLAKLIPYLITWTQNTAFFQKNGIQSERIQTNFSI